MYKKYIAVSMMVFGIIIILVSTVCSASQITVESRLAKVNESFNITVVCNATTFIKGFECRLRFNQSILRANFISETRFFRTYDVYDSPHMGLIDNENGTIRNIYELIVGKGNITGTGTMFTVNFTALKNGVSSIELIDARICNETEYKPVTVINGNVTVKGYMVTSKNEPTGDGTGLLQNLVMGLVIVLLVAFLLFKIIFR